MTVSDWVIVGFIVVLVLELVGRVVNKRRCPMPECEGCGRKPCECECRKQHREDRG